MSSTLASASRSSSPSPGDGDVVDGDGHAAARGVVEADLLDAVDQVRGLDRTEQAVAAPTSSRSAARFMVLFRKRSRSGRIWLNSTRPTVVRTEASTDASVASSQSSSVTSMGECSSSRGTWWWASRRRRRACRSGRS
jgi:D-aminopeptidase